jgi:hypothetical protein
LSKLPSISRTNLAGISSTPISNKKSAILFLVFLYGANIFACEHQWLPLAYGALNFALLVKFKPKRSPAKYLLHINYPLF